MIYSIVSLDDIFYKKAELKNCVRSSNPYDYIRDGYYLDGVMGGERNVHINSYISSHRTGSYLGVAHK